MGLIRSPMSQMGPGCVKTHTSGKCRKHNSLTWHPSVCPQHYQFSRRAISPRCFYARGGCWSFHTAWVIRYRFGRDRLSSNVRFASIPTVNSGLWDLSRCAMSSRAEPAGKHRPLQILAHKGLQDDGHWASRVAVRSSVRGFSPSAASLS
jgi:hypothetical protein